MRKNTPARLCTRLVNNVAARCRFHRLAIVIAIVICSCAAAGLAHSLKLSRRPSPSGAIATNGSSPLDAKSRGTIAAHAFSPDSALANKPSQSVSATHTEGFVSTSDLAAQEERLEAELVTVHPTGFEPTEITRPKGKFLLIVNNRSGLTEVDLQLRRNAGTKLREKKLQFAKRRWSEVIQLPPGQYEITEANNPEWIFRMTIDDR